MQNSREALQRAVKRAREKGATDEEIAGKLDITEQQLLAYLDGSEETPGGLGHRLGKAYGIQTVIVRHTSTSEAPAPPPPPRDEKERQQQNLQSLRTTIQFLIQINGSKGITVTLEDLADKAGISAKQLAGYQAGEEVIPDDLVTRLHSAYQPLLDRIHFDSNREALQNSIVLIRNKGLAQGMDITLQDMAEKIGLTKERLHAYLDGAYDTLESYAWILEKAYPDLIKKEDQVVIQEDYYMIKRS